jgi:hypothetical protein
MITINVNSRFQFQIKIKQTIAWIGRLLINNERWIIDYKYHKEETQLKLISAQL